MNYTSTRTKPQPLKPRREFHRRTVDQTQLCEAVQAVKRNGFSIRVAAERFGVSKSTLHRALQNNSCSDQDTVPDTACPASSTPTESVSEFSCDYSVYNFALLGELFE